MHQDPQLEVVQLLRLGHLEVQRVRLLEVVQRVQRVDLLRQRLPRFEPGMLLLWPRTSCLRVGS